MTEARLMALRAGTRVVVVAPARGRDPAIPAGLLLTLRDNPWWRTLHRESVTAEGGVWLARGEEVEVAL